MEKNFVTFTECLKMYPLAPIKYYDILTLFNRSHRNFTAYLFKEEKHGKKMRLFIDHKAFLEWLHADASMDRKNSMRQRYQQAHIIPKKLPNELGDLIKKFTAPVNPNIIGYPEYEHFCEIVDFKGEKTLLMTVCIPLNNLLQVEI